MTLTHRISGERLVAMKFTDVQHKPELEVTQAEAAEVATQIRRFDEQFDPVIAPITTK